MIQAFYINVKYSADAIHSDRLRRQPGRRHGLSRHRLGPRNVPPEAKAGERNSRPRASAGVRQRPAGSWELGISAQRAARRTLWLVSSAGSSTHALAGQLSVPSLWWHRRREQCRTGPRSIRHQLGLLGSRWKHILSCVNLCRA